MSSFIGAAVDRSPAVTRCVLISVEPDRHMKASLSPTLIIVYTAPKIELLDRHVVEPAGEGKRVAETRQSRLRGNEGFLDRILGPFGCAAGAPENKFETFPRPDN